MPDAEGMPPHLASGGRWSSKVGTELREEVAERRLERDVGNLEARVGVHHELIRQRRKD